MPASVFWLKEWHKDKALEYLKAGYKVYKDETCTEEITEDELNDAIDVTTGGSPSSSTSHTVSLEEILSAMEED